MNYPTWYANCFSSAQPLRGPGKIDRAAAPLRAPGPGGRHGLWGFHHVQQPRKSYCARDPNSANPPPSTPPPALRVSGKQPVFENANLWTSDDCKRVLFRNHAAIGHGEIFATATRDVHFLESAVGDVKKMVKCFFETKDAVF